MLSETEYSAHQEIWNYNRDGVWIHPRTCFRILRNIRCLQPVRVDTDAFWDVICPSKWGFNDRDIKVIKDIVKDVEIKGALGILAIQLKVS